MKHLDDGQISTAVAGLDLDAEGRGHLESCVDCRRRVGMMAELIDARRLRMKDEEPDWAAQHEAVLGRLPSASQTPPVRSSGWWRPAMAVAAALAVVAVVSLVGPRSPELASDNSEIPVAEILAEVDALLEDDSIPGFEIIDPGLDGLEGVIANPSS